MTPDLGQSAIDKISSLKAAANPTSVDSPAPGADNPQTPPPTPPPTPGADVVVDPVLPAVDPPVPGTEPSPATPQVPTPPSPVIPTVQFDPLAVHIDAMRKEGKSPSEIRDFVNLQTEDYNAMPAIDALRKYYRLSNPDLSESAVEDFLAREYPDHENPDSGDAVKIKMASTSAREYLVKYQAAALTESAFVAQATENATQVLQSWAGPVENIAQQFKTVKITAEKGDFKWNMDYIPNPEDAKQIKDMVYAKVQRLGQKATPELVAGITQEVAGVVRAYYVNNHLAEFVKDAYDKGRQDEIEKNLGLGKGAPTPVPSGAGLDKLSAIKGVMNNFYKK